MPEKHEKLRATLQELESELATLNSLDDETRTALETVLQEISDTLGKRAPTEPAQHGTLASRLQDAAEEFETSHPTLFGIVTRTIDALGQMGI
ncbi:MAG: DUF4404 family protein [Pirellulaceae bacterium]